MNKIPYKRTFFIFFSMMTTLLSAQSTREQALQALDKLHNGTLIVLLESNSKTIFYYDSLMKIDKKAAPGIAEKKTRTLIMRDAKNKAIIDAFHTKYNFSKVMFLYDYQYHYKTQQYTGAFLDDQMKPDITQRHNGENFFIGGLMDRMIHDQFKYQFYVLNPDGTELPDKIDGDVLTTFLVFQRSPATIISKLNKSLTKRRARLSR